jgi:methyl-accepting chemotaxis protein
MNIVKSTTISTKLFGALLVSITFLVVCFIVNNWWLRNLAGEFESYVKADQGIGELATEMYTQGVQIELALRTMLVNPEDGVSQESFQAAVKAFDAALATARSKAGQDSPVAHDLESLAKVWQESSATKQRILELLKQKQYAEVKRLTLSEEIPKWQESKKALLEIQTKNKEYFKGLQRGISSFVGEVSFKASVLFLAMISVVTLLLGTIMLMIRKDMNNFVKRVQAIAEGDIDLTKHLSAARDDEFGRLAGHFNRFIDRLHDIVAKVTDDTVKVSGSASQLFMNSGTLTAVSDRAAIEVSAVATASEEMSATSNDIACNCLSAVESARRSTDLAQHGSAVVKSSVLIMGNIARQVQEAARTVENLGSQSDRIGEIVGTIEDIADQTNLLALNAAIEAARAGEQGRGFAVVADEVRALAERTTRATQEIGEMIKAVQQQTRSAVAVMERGVEEVEIGTREASRSGEALDEILSQIGDVAMQINQIATAAEEQTATTNEITQNIHAINDVIYRTQEFAKISAQEAQALGALSEGLQDGVKEFHTRSTDLLILEIAKNDHRLFVSRMHAAVRGEISVIPNEIATHHTCRFGKWYEGIGREMCGDLSSYRAINAPHERIHALAKEAVTVAKTGDLPQALKMMSEVDGLSSQVISMLSSIRSEFEAGRR